MISLNHQTAYITNYMQNVAHHLPLDQGVKYLTPWLNHQIAYITNYMQNVAHHLPLD